MFSKILFFVLTAVVAATSTDGSPDTLLVAAFLALLAIGAVELVDLVYEMRLPGFISCLGLLAMLHKNGLFDTTTTVVLTGLVIAIMLGLFVQWAWRLTKEGSV